MRRAALSVLLATSACGRENFDDAGSSQAVIGTITVRAFNASIAYAVLYGQF